MSIVKSLLSLFPREIACCILEYDPRFYVRAGKMHEITRISKKDRRIKMLDIMFRERKLNLDWFDLEDYHDLRPKFVIMINGYDKYVLRIWNAEYFSNDTGETYFEMTRELMILRGRNEMEVVCEY